MAKHFCLSVVTHLEVIEHIGREIAVVFNQKNFHEGVEKTYSEAMSLFR